MARPDSVIGQMLTSSPSPANQTIMDKTFLSDGDAGPRLMPTDLPKTRAKTLADTTNDILQNKAVPWQEYDGGGLDKAPLGVYSPALQRLAKTAFKNEVLSRKGVDVNGYALAPDGMSSGAYRKMILDTGKYTAPSFKRLEKDMEAEQSRSGPDEELTKRKGGKS